MFDNVGSFSSVQFFPVSLCPASWSRRHFCLSVFVASSCYPWRLRSKRFDGMLAQNANASTHMCVAWMYQRRRLCNMCRPHPSLALSDNSLWQAQAGHSGARHGTWTVAQTQTQFPTPFQFLALCVAQARDILGRCSEPVIEVPADCQFSDVMRSYLYLRYPLPHTKYLCLNKFVIKQAQKQLN
ncbi:hypothetical protein ACLKA7_013938 [Drosophila subpalustris]